MSAPDRSPGGCFNESYADGFSELAVAMASGDESRSRRLVEAIANPGALDPARRQPWSLRRWTAVFVRDSYTCRYCERRTIAPPVLRVVSRKFPDVFRYHPNWKTNETDTAYFTLSTSADHIQPVTRQGSDDPKNLATACWMCNGMKSNFLLEELGWTLKDPAGSSWRGLTEYLERMMASAGVTKEPYFSMWLNAIRDPEPIES